MLTKSEQLVPNGFGSKSACLKGNLLFYSGKLRQEFSCECQASIQQGAVENYSSPQGASGIPTLLPRGAEVARCQEGGYISSACFHGYNK